jgi:hypothetical protein
MKKLSIRGEAIGTLTEAEQREFIDWAIHARSRMSFDPQIVGHRRASMLVAEGTAYLLTQMAIMAEAFIPRPDATNREKALALGRFNEALLDIAKAIKVDDIYCYVPVGEADYADKLQRHGWEERPNVRLFKRRTGISK